MAEKFTFIGVIGGSEVSPDIALQAEEAGREIARRGGVVVCGGMGGVMEAACRGAVSEGGLTIGIVPGDSRRVANPYVRIPIVTGIGYARNVAVVKTSQAVIAIDGSYGTLTEIAYALQSGIPVIGLGTWSVSIDGKEVTEIIRASSPREAVETAFSLLASRQAGQ
ncbi:MAG: TIGR00725 family protein [Dehalococcoidales bacterium]|nr:TIGR00725 family protein [Dehalococcoidales bacterium]